MGVYVYRSLHAAYVKVGHYAGKNAWSRVAHRGFYSCNRPAALGERISVDDVELVAWYPHLTRQDERDVKKKWQIQRRRTEWYPAELEADILAFLDARDNDAHTSCSKAAALAVKKRL